MGFRIDPDQIIYADLTPEEGVVLNLKTKNYYKLNETGQLVWQALSRNQSRDQIVQHLSEIYETPLETLQADVDRLLKEFKDEKLITSDIPSIQFDVNAARKSKKEHPL
jgi:hypothetical protein